MKEIDLLQALGDHLGEVRPETELDSLAKVEVVALLHELGLADDLPDGIEDGLLTIRDVLVFADRLPDRLRFR